MKMICTAKVPKPSESLREWCREALQAEQLVRLPVEPSFELMPMTCLTNTEIMCRLSGGRLAEGWLLWNNYDKLISTEHHIAWERPDGVLIDPTPQNGFPHVAFADSGRRHTVDTPEFEQLVQDWNEEHISGTNLPPDLVLVDHPIVRELAAELSRAQAAFMRYMNGQRLAGYEPDQLTVERFYLKLDRIGQALEEFTIPSRSDTSKLRAKRKAERKRKKRQRRCRR